MSFINPLKLKSFHDETPINKCLIYVNSMVNPGIKYLLFTLVLKSYSIVTDNILVKFNIIV